MMSRIARIAIESMCLAEMHCDLNRERPTLIEIKIPSDTLDPDTSAYLAAAQALVSGI